MKRNLNGIIIVFNLFRNKEYCFSNKMKMESVYTLLNYLVQKYCFLLCTTINLDIYTLSCKFNRSDSFEQYSPFGL